MGRLRRVLLRLLLRLSLEQLRRLLWLVLRLVLVHLLEAWCGGVCLGGVVRPRGGGAEAETARRGRCRCVDDGGRPASGWRLCAGRQGRVSAGVQVGRRRGLLFLGRLLLLLLRLLLLLLLLLLVLLLLLWRNSGLYFDGQGRFRLYAHKRRRKRGLTR